MRPILTAVGLGASKSSIFRSTIYSTGCVWMPSFVVSRIEFLVFFLFVLFCFVLFCFVLFFLSLFGGRAFHTRE